MRCVKGYLTSSGKFFLCRDECRMADILELGSIIRDLSEILVRKTPLNGEVADRFILVGKQIEEAQHKLRLLLREHNRKYISASSAWHGEA